MVLEQATKLLHRCEVHFSCRKDGPRRLYGPHVLSVTVVAMNVDNNGRLARSINIRYTTYNYQVFLPRNKYVYSGLRSCISFSFIIELFSVLRLIGNGFCDARIADVERGLHGNGTVERFE